MTRTATFLALFTISLWSFLALLASRLRGVPPFLLVGIALCIGGLIGLPKIKEWRVPWCTLVVGIYGLFGYHFLLFTAFKYAPAVEANLINYLWPLLIVLLSPVILPEHRLRPHHLLGAFVGLAGAGLIVTGGKFNLDFANLKGYLLAGGAAFVWASYSLFTKRVSPFPTSAVAAFCFYSGLLSLGVYTLTTGSLTGFVKIPGRDWLSLILLGIGPMGLAFFTWDAALKRGDPRIIGSLTYLTPLLSTLNLVVWGGGSFTWVSLVAMVLILSGAVIGAWDLLKQR